MCSRLFRQVVCVCCVVGSGGDDVLVVCAVVWRSLVWRGPGPGATVDSGTVAQWSPAEGPVCWPWHLLTPEVCVCCLCYTWRTVAYGGVMP